MRINFKQNSSFSLVIVLFLSIFIFISQAKGKEETVKPQSDAQEIFSTGTRVIISTSGPAKFSFHWLDEPPRLVVEFQSRNILSKMSDEVIVERGGIKKIISTYVGRRQDRSLQSLTFELNEKVPYKIWQEENAIVLDIQTSLEVSVFTIGARGIVESTEGETKDMIIKRLEVMDTALAQVVKSQAPTVESIVPLEYPTEDIKDKTLEEISFEEVIPPKDRIIPITEPEAIPTIGEEKVNIGFWLGFVGLIVISGLGFWLWCIWYKRKPSIDEKIRKLKLELQEKDNQLKHGGTIRKAIEKASLEKDQEYKKLEQELQERDTQLKQEKEIRQATEKAVSEKEEAYRKLGLELKEKNNQLKQAQSAQGTAKQAMLEKEEEVKKLKTELQGMDSGLKQTGAALEEEKRQASEKEEERKRLELELEEKNSELKKVQALHESAKIAVLEKEEECKKLKDSYNSLEDIMIKKTLVKKMISPEGKETFWIPGKSQEKRAFPRLSLTKDFNKSIVVRIEPRSQPHIRCFVNNISSGGLCFESPKDFFKEKEIVNLRLFFYGDKTPMIKAQARIIWKRTIGQVYYYGVSFELLEEEGKVEFDRYIETNIAEKATVEV